MRQWSGFPVRAGAGAAVVAGTFGRVVRAGRGDEVEHGDEPGGDDREVRVGALALGGGTEVAAGQEAPREEAGGAALGGEGQPGDEGGEVAVRGHAARPRAQPGGEELID